MVVVTADPDELHDPVTKRLARHCPCHVWVEQPATGDGRDVLAVVDPDSDEVELNRSILETTAMMRNLSGGRLFVLHAWEFHGMTWLRHSAYLHPSDATVDAVASRGVAGLVVGDTAEQVLDYAQCSVVAVKPEWFALLGE